MGTSFDSRIRIRILTKSCRKLSILVKSWKYLIWCVNLSNKTGNRGKQTKKWGRSLESVQYSSQVIVRFTRLIGNIFIEHAQSRMKLYFLEIHNWYRQNFYFGFEWCQLFKEIFLIWLPRYQKESSCYILSFLLNSSYNIHTCLCNFIFLWTQ